MAHCIHVIFRRFEQKAGKMDTWKQACHAAQEVMWYQEIAVQNFYSVVVKKLCLPNSTFKKLSISMSTSSV